jgi:hypothetical protein
MKTEWAAKSGFAMVLVVAVIVTACAIVFAASTKATGSRPRRTPVEGTEQIPRGTILPVSLENSIKLQEARKGDAIGARIVQDVPLPDGGKIRTRSKVLGTIDSVERDAAGSGVDLSFHFDKVEFGNKTVPIVTSLRAMASYRAVRAAQMPLTGAESGTPAGWGTTVLIGGDIRFGDGGKVRNRSKQVVGKGVTGGVLVHVHAQPAAGCEGPVNGDDHPQALWVFSSDACGVYDLKGVKIAHNAKSEPVGEITLGFLKDDMKLESGTGLLLRVASPK